MTNYKRVAIYFLPKKNSSLENFGKNLLGRLFGGGDDGESVPLGTSFLMPINKRQVIPLPSLQDGSYSLTWRAMGEDGHVVKGELTFNIKGN